MDSNTQQPIEIDFRDLLFVIIKKIGFVILAGIVFAGALFGYKLISNVKDANVLDTSIMLEDETDTKYAERVLNVNRAEDIINSIDALNAQTEMQRTYVANSIIMQIDPLNEAVTTAQFVVIIDDSSANGMDKALVSSYWEDILSSDYLVNLSEELGTEQNYLKELVQVEYSSSSAVIVNNEGSVGSVGTLTITVIGPVTDYTDKIMDCVIEEINSKYNEFNDTITNHTITLAARQSFYMVDNNTRDLQYNAANRFGSIQKQIETYDESLDKLVSELGVSSKESLYEYFSSDSVTGSGDSYSWGSAIKFAVIGLLGGAFIALLIVFVKYIFGKRFETQAKFFGRFSRVYKIGVAKPDGKRSGFSKLIDLKTGDDNELSAENSLKLMAANIKNLTSGMNKILVTGTADTSKIKVLLSELKIDADVKESIFADPTTLAQISEYDGVIIVEQRNYSDCKKVAEELSLIANTSTKLIGAIVI